MFYSAVDSNSDGRTEFEIESSAALDFLPSAIDLDADLPLHPVPPPNPRSAQCPYPDTPRTKDPGSPYHPISRDRKLVAPGRPSPRNLWPTPPGPHCDELAKIAKQHSIATMKIIARLAHSRTNLNEDVSSALNAEVQNDLRFLT